jgi:RNA polymerase sigma-70 factor (ECF subfamily)
MDAESRRWLADLRSAGATRDAAVRRLGALLLDAARWEVGRRSAATPHLRGDELDDLAAQAAHDALMAVLAKLDGFRGASRFTTWASKFALLEAAVAMRRQAWQRREVVLEPDQWELLASPGQGPSHDAETAELLSSLVTGIKRDLTAHQREVLIALTIAGVPIDVLADRLGSTRNALYKTLHDARRKLRRRLEADGLLGVSARSEAHR